MKNNSGSSIRNRILFNVVISFMYTFIVEAFIYYDLRLIADYRSEAEYVNTGYAHEMGMTGLQITVMFLVGIAAFLISLMLLMENMVRYIKEITGSIRKIADGDLNEVIAVKGNDELAYIAASLNDMTDKLLELMEKERDSERSKNELITNVAHDLRTPLTSIIGYMGYLNTKRDIDEATRNNYIQVVYGKAKRLEKLIEDLFSFTKLNYGKIAMHVEKVDIVMLLNQLLDDFYPSFENNSLECELICAKKSIVVNADGSLLARLFDNLINNAVKYGKEGKYVRIHIREDEENVIVSVINYGYVIPKEDIKNLFNKFFRVEQSRSSNTGGTGLGLAIVKNIVDMHKGTIDVRSDLDGTEFEVTLPKHFDIDEEVFGV